MSRTLHHQISTPKRKKSSGKFLVLLLIAAGLGLYFAKKSSETNEAEKALAAAEETKTSVKISPEAIDITATKESHNVAPSEVPVNIQTNAEGNLQVHLPPTEASADGAAAAAPVGIEKMTERETQDFLEAKEIKEVGKAMTKMKSFAAFPRTVQAFSGTFKGEMTPANFQNESKYRPEQQAHAIFHLTGTVKDGDFSGKYKLLTVDPATTVKSEVNGVGKIVDIMSTDDTTPNLIIADGAKDAGYYQLFIQGDTIVGNVYQTEKGEEHIVARLKLVRQ